MGGGGRLRGGRGDGEERGVVFGWDYCYILFGFSGNNRTSNRNSNSNILIIMF